MRYRYRCIYSRIRLQRYSRDCRYNRKVLSPYKFAHIIFSRNRNFRHNNRTDAISGVAITGFQCIYKIECVLIIIFDSLLSIKIDNYKSIITIMNFPLYPQTLYHYYNKYIKNEYISPLGYLLVVHCRLEHSYLLALAGRGAGCQHK